MSFSSDVKTELCRSVPKHAGREFWVSRRIFGRVAISKADNPNLRDKAGREGFIDNTAKNLFKQLIVDVLKESASSRSKSFMDNCSVIFFSIQ